MLRFLVVLLCMLPGAAWSQDMAIWTDDFQNGFRDWSYATRDFNVTNPPPHSGSKCMSFEPDDYAALKFQTAANSTFDTSKFQALSFWVFSRAPGGQRLRIQLRSAENTSSVLLSDYLPNGPPVGVWTEVRIPMAHFGVPELKTNLVIMSDVSADQATMYLDDIVLLASAGPTPTPTPTPTPSPSPTPPPLTGSSVPVPGGQYDCNCACAGAASVTLKPTPIPTPTPTPTPTPSPSPTPPPSGTTGWLRTQGSKILRANGTTWVGRGANIHDPRSCWACAGNPSVPEVKRRIDEAVNVWKMDFLRLVLESDNDAQSPLNNPQYLADITEIVRYVGTKPGVYVLVSLWNGPYIGNMGRPNEKTPPTWTALVNSIKTLPNGAPHVMFGIVNEPEGNYGGQDDATVWTMMNNNVAAIRAAEGSGPKHIVTVQGTGGWARYIQYYVTHPITAGGGVNVAYETHVYDPQAEFAKLFETPSKSIPVVIGEFGPDGTYMQMADAEALMPRAEAARVPYLAWTFHMRCPPNLLVDGSGGGCGVGMALRATAWGQVLQKRLASPVQ